MKQVIAVRTLIYVGSDDWVQRTLEKGNVPAIGTKYLTSDTFIQSDLTFVEPFENSSEFPEPEFPEGRSDKWEKKFKKYQPTLYAKALELTADKLFEKFPMCPSCDERDPNSLYVCSRVSLHTGKHIASTGDQICAIWSEQEK